MNSFYFWDEMAAKCLKSEHFREAIQSYKHALEATDVSADQASVWANIGNIYLTLQDIPCAVDAFLTASRLDPSSYDFDCILERITANGYLDESAMIIAKDMYAMESVKTGLESEAGIDQFPADVLVAEEENAPAADVELAESLAVQAAIEPVVTISEPITVESVSAEEASQPVADAAPSEVTAEVAPVETAPVLEAIGMAVDVALPEPVAQVELPEVAVEIEPVEPVSSEEINQPIADVTPSEVTTEIAAVETAPMLEAIGMAVDVALPEPVAQAELPEVAVEIEPVEPVSSEEINQPVADVTPSEVSTEAEVAETAPAPEIPALTADVAISEPVAQTELPEVVVEIEPVESVSSEEISQPVAAVASSEVGAEAEVVETVPACEALEMAVDVVVSEPVAEETNPEMQTVSELPESTAADETSTVFAGAVDAETVSEPATAPAYILIPIAEILENPLNLRVSMQSEDLVESVRQHGILQPLVVTQMDDGIYMVMSGNRKLEAARLAGLELIPAVVRSATEREFLELALIENIQRVNLDPLELAEAYHLLVENFGMSVDLVAASIGKSCSVVAAALNLLKLTEEGKQALQERSISEGHARALVEIDLPALQNNALVYILENRLGVRQTEDLVRIILNAVAVSRSYDEFYHEDATPESQQEPEPVESAEEVAVETAESELAVETELPSTETDTPFDIVDERESPQTVADAPVTNPEPDVVIEPASDVESKTTAEVVSVVEQPIAVEMTDEAVLDLLVAESEEADVLLENNAAEDKSEQAASESVLDDETIDFYWIKPEVEAENQAQPDGILLPASFEFSTEKTLEKADSIATVPAESIFAAVNGNVTRNMAIETEVIVADPALSPVVETVLQKTEENLEDVIEEIVQFTPASASPLDESSADANPEPIVESEEPGTSAQKEPEGAEVRTELKGFEAIAVYRRVVENNPANVRIWHLLGNLYSDMGQYEEAIDCLKRTIDLDPGKYTYFYHLGLTLAIARRYPDAIQALEKTIELAPQHILAHCSLAGCYRRMGNETEAQKHIEVARPKLMQEKAYNRACFEFISGNVDQAIELLQLALDTDKTPVEWLLRDPDLDFIREDPRFQAMVAELNAPIKEL